MVEFTSGRIATQAWGRSLRFIVAAGEHVLIKLFGRQEDQAERQVKKRRL
jgi:hypothetical protein